VRVLYGRAFSNVNMAQLCKHTSSQFDDQLITRHDKTMKGLTNASFTALVNIKTKEDKA